MIARGILVVLGVALIGFALTLGQFEFIGLAPGGGGQFVLIGLGALLIALGMLGTRMKAHRLVQGYQQVGLLLLNLIIALVSLEMLVILSFNVQFITGGLARPPERDQFPGYTDTDWYTATWREFDIVNPRNLYSAFDLWGRMPYRGSAITIDEDGTRHTPGTACGDPAAYRIFMYGGSTMWGMGAPDAMTIPAYLQARLGTETARPLCVVNYGELGFVSMQGVIRLMKSLQTGDVPDMVIFYDGVNDVVAADQTGQAGLHRNLGTFQQAVATQSHQLHPLLRLLIDSYTFQFVRGLIGGEAAAQALQRSATLADDVTERYLANARMVRALGAEYGFVAHFFWQPVMVVGDKPLTPEEKRMAAVVHDPLLSLYRDTWARVAAVAGQPPYTHLHDIARALDAYDTLLYFDHHHLLPEGNAIIAQVMAETIMTDIE